MLCQLFVCLAGCAVVSVFGSGGKLSVFLLWRESFITTGKKVPVVWRLRPEKKSSSRLFGGLCCCVSFWFWQEIGNFFVVAGKFYYDRKKKVLVVCQAGCAVVSVFGSGNYDRKKKI